LIADIDRFNGYGTQLDDALGFFLVKPGCIAFGSIKEGHYLECHGFYYEQ
jgi:hypothetical protein